MAFEGELIQSNQVDRTSILGSSAVSEIVVPENLFMVFIKRFTDKIHTPCVVVPGFKGHDGKIGWSLFKGKPKDTTKGVRIVPEKLEDHPDFGMRPHDFFVSTVMAEAGNIVPYACQIIPSHRVFKPINIDGYNIQAYANIPIESQQFRTKLSPIERRIVNACMMQIGDNITSTPS